MSGNQLLWFLGEQLLGNTQNHLFARLKIFRFPTDQRETFSKTKMASKLPTVGRVVTEVTIDAIKSLIVTNNSIAIVPFHFLSISVAIF